MNRQKKIQKSKTQDLKDTNKGFDVNNDLITKAFAIIQKVQTDINQNSKNLLELSKHSFLYVNIVLNQLPVKKSIKPAHVPLKKSIYGPSFSTKHVLIVSDSFKQNNREALCALSENWKFISYEKISKNYKQYKDKMSLLKDYDIFFCEGKIYMLLKKHLGKHFYEGKKYPFPVNLDILEQKETKFDSNQFRSFLNSLVENSTYFVQGNGPEYSLKVARLDKFSATEVVKNVKSGIKGMIKLLMEKGIKLSNVRRIVLKGEKTESFPIYSYLTPTERKLMAEIVNEKQSFN